MATTIVRKKLSILDIVICFALLLGGYSSALAATYYVSGNGSDSNPGTQAQPWKTIGKASATMGAGDTAIVAAGTYNERVTTARGGASGKPISFKASGRVVMKGFVVSKDHITIDGFEITNVGAATAIPITGNYCQLINNNIRDTYATINEIKISGSYAVIRGNRISSVAKYPKDHPVMDFGGNYALVENNEIGPMNDVDVARPFGVGHVFRNNYIHDLRVTGGAHSDILQVWGPAGAKSNNILFENNKVVNAQSAPFMTSQGRLPDIGNWEIRNNVYVNMQIQATVGIPNLRIYNNTFYNAGYANGFAINLSATSGKDPSYAKIINNIFVAGGGLTKTSMPGPYLISGGTGIVKDYNFVAGGPGTGYSKIANFAEAHGVNGGDPKFVNLSKFDLRLQAGSPAINRGAAMTGFNYDGNRVKRPQGGAWDIGAFEHTTSSASTLEPPQNLRAMQ